MRNMCYNECSTKLYQIILFYSMQLNVYTKNHLTSRQYKLNDNYGCPVDKGQVSIPKSLEKRKFAH